MYSSRNDSMVRKEISEYCSRETNSCFSIRETMRLAWITVSSRDESHAIYSEYLTTMACKVIQICNTSRRYLQTSRRQVLWHESLQKHMSTIWAPTQPSETACKRLRLLAQFLPCDWFNLIGRQIDGLIAEAFAMFPFAPFIDSAWLHRCRSRNVGYMASWLMEMHKRQQRGHRS